MYACSFIRRYLYCRSMNEDKFCQIIKEEEKISKGEVLGTAISIRYVGGIYYSDI